jgi:hypothetical protein
MEQVQVEGGEAGITWFTGLPLGVWLMIAAVMLSIGVVLLCFALASVSGESDYRVRGWENRPKQTGEDDWWAREYPMGSEDVDEWDWSREHG